MLQRFKRAWEIFSGNSLMQKSGFSFFFFPPSLKICLRGPAGGGKVLKIQECQEMAEERGRRKVGVGQKRREGRGGQLGQGGEGKGKLDRQAKNSGTSAYHKAQDRSRKSSCLTASLSHEASSVSQISSGPRTPTLDWSRAGNAVGNRNTLLVFS